MAKYIIDLPDEGKYRLGQAYIFANDGEKIAASCNLTDLTPYTEPDREAIENEVWEFVKILGSISQNQRKEIFGDVAYWYVLDTFNYQQAKTKYEEWRKQKDNVVKQKVVDLAEEIGIHRLYAIVREIRGE